MTTTVTSSTLKVTVREEITLNGIKHDYIKTQSVAGVNMVSQRIVRVPTSVTTLVSFGATVAAGQYVAADLKYVRVTNLDDTNYVTLKLVDTGADCAFLKLSPRETMVFRDTNLEVKADGGVWAAWSTIDSISAQANTAEVDVEIFVASSQS